MKKITSIRVDGCQKDIAIIADRWTNGQSGFENASGYLIIDEENEKCVGSISVTDNKHFWEIYTELGFEAEHDILSYMLAL